uniref:Uncharacterized protein n=1 Tax=Loa loa TaxID=7209 RepID=A0A1I7VWF8_LOALO
MTKCDYDLAERMLIKQAQSQDLTDEEKDKWSLYQHKSDKLWRSSSRLGYSELDEESKYPICLLKTNLITEPIATRTKRARKLLNVERTSKPKFLRTLFVLNVITLMVAQIQAMSNCMWKSGIPFNIPEKWNCESITNQIFTLHKGDVYTRTHVQIPAIKCSNITRTVCTKLCRAIYANRQDGINAELELLAHRHEETFYQSPTSDPTLNRQRNSSLWQEIAAQGEEVTRQLGNQFNQFTKMIKEEIDSITTH